MGVRRAHVDGMQERINRLETLVTSLISQSQGLKPERPYADQPISEGAAYIQSSALSGPFVKDSSTTDEEVQQGVGVMSVNEHRSLYRGASHWSDVLQQVRSTSCWTKVKTDMPVAAQ